MGIALPGSRKRERERERSLGSRRDSRPRDVSRLFRERARAESIVSVTMAGKTTAAATSRDDDRRISFRGINAAIKDRECRVLAPLKRRLAPALRAALRRPRCNLRRDYDVRLRNPAGATALLRRTSPGNSPCSSAYRFRPRRSCRTPETPIIRIPIIELFPHVALI